MEHTEAMEKMMAERYLLGELLEEDRDAFEEHFFGCSECATAVRDGAVLLDSGRAVVRERPDNVVPMRPRWFSRLSAAAAVAAISLLGYQNFALRGALHEVRLTAAHSLLMTGSRGATLPATEPPFEVRRDRPFDLMFDVPAESQYTSYRVQVRDASNKIKLSGPAIDTVTAKETLVLTVPAGSLPEGSYNLVVFGLRERGAPATEIARSSFRIRVQ
jgi:anti-sigma factor RsiW